MNDTTPNGSPTTPSPPDTFEASIGGFTGASYRVSLIDKDTLLYEMNPQTFTTAEGTRREKVKVTPADWETFRKKLEAANIWSWKSEYLDPNVLDGTVWQLKIAYPEQEQTSRGSNAYPLKSEFNLLTAAISDLIGGRAFQ